MKVLIGAAAAVFLFGAVASAQTTTTTSTTTTAAASVSVPPSRCPAMPTEPTIPDGATASSATMATANEAYRAWALAVQEIAHCHHAEYDEAVALLQARRDEHNAVAERLNQVTQSWTAASTAYCARPHTRCQNTAAPAANH
ncbi:MAG: hypothetical protein ABUL73_00390 [Alphaproteobacteria bacterium]